MKQQSRSSRFKKSLFHILGRNCRGFSLYELMTVMAIGSILTAAAVPPLLSSKNKYRIRSDARAILSAFKTVQSEAVKRNTDVILRFNQPSTGWYTAFIDNGAGVGGVADNKFRDGDEPELFTKKMNAGSSVEPSPGFTNPGYNNRGLPTDTGNITLSSDSDSRLKVKLIMSNAGFVRSQVSTDGGITWK